MLRIFVLLALSAWGGVSRATPPSEPVVWESPSADSLDSMPLSGRLGAGANVWVQDGSVWLYLGHSGAYDEHGRLLKLGCVRLTPIVRTQSAIAWPWLHHGPFAAGGTLIIF